MRRTIASRTSRRRNSCPHRRASATACLRAADCSADGPEKRHDRGHRRPVFNTLPMFVSSRPSAGRPLAPALEAAARVRCARRRRIQCACDGRRVGATKRIAGHDAGLAPAWDRSRPRGGEPLPGRTIVPKRKRAHPCACRLRAAVRAGAAPRGRTPRPVRCGRTARCPADSRARRRPVPPARP